MKTNRNAILSILSGEAKATLKRHAKATELRVNSINRSAAKVRTIAPEAGFEAASRFNLAAAKAIGEASREESAADNSVARSLDFLARFSTVDTTAATVGQLNIASLARIVNRTYPEELQRVDNEAIFSESDRRELSGKFGALANETDTKGAIKLRGEILEEIRTMIEKREGEPRARKAPARKNNGKGKNKARKARKAIAPAPAPAETATAK